MKSVDPDLSKEILEIAGKPAIQYTVGEGRGLETGIDLIIAGGGPSRMKLWGALFDIGSLADHIHASVRFLKVLRSPPIDVVKQWPRVWAMI